MKNGCNKKRYPANPNHFEEPIFVTGCARSGTSLVAGALGLCGAWMGATVPGDYRNPKGFFEHIELRENVLKQILKKIGCDPLGVTKLPHLSTLPEVSNLDDTIYRLIMEEGYACSQPWLYKDAKLALLWPIYRKAFAKARWVIVRRKSQDIVQSCLRTDFMVQHASNPAFWYVWINEYLLRLETLKTSGAWWREIWPHELMSGNLNPLRELVEDLDLTWDEGAVKGFITRDHWHSEVQ